MATLQARSGYEGHWLTREVVAVSRPVQVGTTTEDRHILAEGSAKMSPSSRCMLGQTHIRQFWTPSRPVMDGKQAIHPQKISRVSPLNSLLFPSLSTSFFSPLLLFYSSSLFFSLFSYSLSFLEWFFFPRILLFATHRNNNTTCLKMVLCFPSVRGNTAVVSLHWAPMVDTGATTFFSYPWIKRRSLDWVIVYYI